MTHQKCLRNTGLASDGTAQWERDHVKANPPQSCESRHSGCTADLASCPGRRLTCTKALLLPSTGSLLTRSRQAWSQDSGLRLGLGGKLPGETHHLPPCGTERPAGPGRAVRCQTPVRFANSLRRILKESLSDHLNVKMPSPTRALYLPCRFTH